MAPEHLRALVGRTPALIRQVDQPIGHLFAGDGPGRDAHGPPPLRAERELLGAPLADRGDGPGAEQGGRLGPSGAARTSPGAWRASPASAWRADPSRRYQRADHLADDLRRLLEDRPLKHAPELSRVEQARKFARRHPRLTSSGTVAGAAALVLLAVGSALAAARIQLADARARDLVRAHDAGVHAGALPGQYPAGPPGPPARGDRGLRADARPLRRPGDAGLGPASGLAPAGPGGSPAAGRGSSRAAAAPGRRPRPAGRRDPGLRRAGPAICSTRPSRSPACPAPARSGSTGRGTGRCGASRSAPPRPADAPSGPPPRPPATTT